MIPKWSRIKNTQRDKVWRMGRKFSKKKKKGFYGRQPKEKGQVGPGPGYSVGIHGWHTREEQKEKGRLGSSSSTSGLCDFGQAPAPETLASF